MSSLQIYIKYIKYMVILSTLFCLEIHAALPVADAYDDYGLRMSVALFFYSKIYMRVLINHQSVN